MSSDTLFRKKERGGMHFHGRKRSKTGVAGFVLSISAVILLVVLCGISAAAQGQAGEFIGVLGLLSMIMSGVAFFLCFKGLKERDVYTRLPFAGLVISGILFVFLFCLYILGIRF